MQRDDDRTYLDDPFGQDEARPRPSFPGESEEGSVFEIDGDVSMMAAEVVSVDDAPDEPIADQQDAMIVVSLEERRVEVEPGDNATIAVTILNNGPTAAVFRVHVEGWIDEDWLVEEALHAVIHPGQRTTVQLIVAPPRVSTSAAGDYPLAVVVRAREYPGRQAKSGLLLVVLPFDELSLTVPADAIRSHLVSPLCHFSSDRGQPGQPGCGSPFPGQ